ncbi:barstar family protein [Streptomyces cellostaticus]|uniref:barstar family protein n=1 Tax=Streptomyces cellostaticus TaxID=67285 RepID=UPI003F8E3FB4
MDGARHPAAGAWLDLVRERGCRLGHQDRRAGRACELDGRYITDEPGLHPALGEAVNGPGGYFRGCPDALVDCLRGGFGHTAPATLVRRDAATAREHLSRVLAPEAKPSDLSSPGGRSAGRGRDARDPQVNRPGRRTVPWVVRGRSARRAVRFGSCLQGPLFPSKSPRLMKLTRFSQTSHVTCLRAPQ